MHLRSKWYTVPWKRKRNREVGIGIVLIKGHFALCHCLSNRIKWWRWSSQSVNVIHNLSTTCPQPHRYCRGGRLATLPTHKSYTSKNNDASLACDGCTLFPFLLSSLSFPMPMTFATRRMDILPWTYTHLHVVANDIRNTSEFSALFRHCQPLKPSPSHTCCIISVLPAVSCSYFFLSRSPWLVRPLPTSFSKLTRRIWSPMIVPSITTVDQLSSLQHGHGPMFLIHHWTSLKSKAQRLSACMTPLRWRGVCINLVVHFLHTFSYFRLSVTPGRIFLRRV